MKVVGCEDFPLDDRKVDFNLVQPAGVDRTMDENESRVFVLEASNRRQSTMGGTIVNDPEHTPSIIVGRPGHHLIDETIKRRNSRPPFAAAKYSGTVNVKGGQVGPGSASFVFVFYLHGRFRLRRQSRVKTATSLNAGFLVGGDNEFI